MELLVLTIMLLAKANGLTVPLPCWIALIGWAALHVGVIWFGEWEGD